MLKILIQNKKEDRTHYFFKRGHAVLSSLALINNIIGLLNSLSISLSLISICSCGVGSTTLVISKPCLISVLI